MDDTRPIRVFLEVAAQSSFAGAARSLGTTPATVTRTVAALEERLGQQLLLRTTRQVSLTSAGAIVAARYRPLMAELDRATSEIRNAAAPDQGRLRINAPMSMGLRLLPDLVEGFRRAYPGIALDVTLTDRLVDIIAEDCDLAIRISGPPSDKSTIWRKVCAVPLHLVAAPSLLERIGTPTHPSELPVDQCLGYARASGRDIWELSHGSAHESVEPAGSVVSNNGDLLYAIAKSGGGIVMLPDFITSGGIERGEVIRLLPNWQIEPLWLTLFYPPYEQLPPLVATFSDFFEEYLQDRDGLEFV